MTMSFGGSTTRPTVVRIILCGLTLERSLLRARVPLLRMPTIAGDRVPVQSAKPPVSPQWKLLVTRRDRYLA